MEKLIAEDGSKEDTMRETQRNEGNADMSSKYDLQQIDAILMVNAYMTEDDRIGFRKNALWWSWLQPGNHV